MDNETANKLIEAINKNTAGILESNVNGKRSQELWERNIAIQEAEQECNERYIALREKEILIQDEHKRYQEMVDNRDVEIEKLQTELTNARSMTSIFHKEIMDLRSQLADYKLIHSQQGIRLSKE